MKAESKNGQNKQGRKLPLAVRLISVVAAILLLPYGTARGNSGAVSGEAENNASVSRAVMERLGIDASDTDATHIEEDLLQAEASVDPSKIILPDAGPTASDCSARKEILLEQIPLGVRTRLLKELANGVEWEAIAPEILSQIPMATAVSICQENALGVTCSLPLQTLGLQDMLEADEFPFGPLSTPCGESSDADEALPANACNGGSLGLGKYISMHPCMTSVRTLGFSTAGALPVARAHDSQKIHSVYYYATMMPTGPPSKEDSDYLPAEYHLLVNAALHPSVGYLRPLLKSTHKDQNKAQKRINSRRRDVLVCDFADTLEGGIP